MSLAIEAFTENDRNFCQWAESNEHDVLSARQVLLALMQGVLYLTVTEGSMNSENEYAFRGYEGWQADHRRFSDFPFQYCREVFDPLELDQDEPVTGDAHDDLADIYGDLWHGLQALERGDGVYAVRHWSQSYFQHWGRHAASLVRAIDEYYRKGKTDDHELLVGPTLPRN
jgi:hypothetical protein